MLTLSHQYEMFRAMQRRLQSERGLSGWMLSGGSQTTFLFLNVTKLFFVPKCYHLSWFHAHTQASISMFFCKKRKNRNFGVTKIDNSHILL